MINQRRDNDSRTLHAPFERLRMGLLVVLMTLAGQSAVGQSNGTATQQAAPTDPSSFDKVNELVKESRRVFAEEILPIQRANYAESARWQSKIQNQRDFIRRLEKVDDKSLEQVRQEIEKLVDKLEVYEQLENVLADMNPGAAERALEQGQGELERLTETIHTITRPYLQEMAQVQQTYNERGEQLASGLTPFFATAGEGDFVGLKRKSSTVNFAYQSFTCRYESANDLPPIMLVLHFQSNLSTKGRDVKKMNGKYDVYQWTDTSLILLINGMQLAIYEHKGAWGKQKLWDAIVELVQLDRLAEFGPPGNR